MKTASPIVSGSGNTAVPSFAIRELQDEQTDHLPHRHDCYEMIWIISGSGRNSIDFNQHLVVNNQLFCIKPGQVHHFCPDAGIKGFSFFFTASFINTGELEFDLDCCRLFQLFAAFNGTVINPEFIDDLTGIAHKIQREISHLHLFQNEILKRYLKIFFIYLTRQFEDSLYTLGQTRRDEMTQRFTRLLDTHFKVMKMVAEYARELCVTPNYLNEIIKKSTGHSAGYHIRQRIVLEAKRLALYSPVSMKEIAYELGFSDPAHFSKFFKMVSGNNFSQFKNERLSFSNRRKRSAGSPIRIERIA